MNRRTQQYGYKYDYSAAYSTGTIHLTSHCLLIFELDTKKKRESRVSKTTPIPPWLDKYCNKLVTEGYFIEKPDQVNSERFFF